MKLILENWRQYLEEGATFPTTVFHGSPDDFDFIKDFQFGGDHPGVGSLYTFFTPEPAKEFALLHDKIPECKGYSFTLSSVTKQNPEPKDGLNQKRIKNLLFPPEQE